MALTTADIDTIRTVFNEGLETLVIPRFEEIDARFDRLEGRMDSRMDLLEHEVHTGFAEVNSRLDALENTTMALENDIKELYVMVATIQHGGVTDSAFAQQKLEDKVLTLHAELQKVAKQAGISLPPA